MDLRRHGLGGTGLGRKGGSGGGDGDGGLGLEDGFTGLGRLHLDEILLGDSLSCLENLFDGHSGFVRDALERVEYHLSDGSSHS